MSLNIKEEHFRPTIVTVSRKAIQDNVKNHLKQLPKNTELVAVVKANGYGHGSIEVLREAINAGAKWAAIATINEALELRDAGFTIPILLLGTWNYKAIPYFYKLNLVPTIFSLEVAQLLNEYSKEHHSIPVHLKIDTGMGRIGLSSEEIEIFLNEPKYNSHLQIDGVISHFSSADEGNPQFSNQQIQKFNQHLKQVRKQHSPKWIHLANSAGITDFTLPECNLFRLGIGLYGQPASSDLQTPIPLNEAIRWTTEIEHLKCVPTGTPISYGRTFITQRETKVAVLPLGYADGFSRSLSNQGEVLVQGERAPIIGRVCMDMTMIDVTDIKNVKLHDEVVLIGQQKEKYISATEMASLLNTINYEITCSISSRVPRIYY